MSEILKMNLKTLNERLEAASLAGGVASQLERRIQSVEDNGISLMSSAHSLTREVKTETIVAIERLILDDLEAQLEAATEDFHNKITGGQK